MGQTSLVTLKGHTDQIKSISINHDGSLLASGSLDNSIIIWETKTGRLVKKINLGIKEIAHIEFENFKNNVICTGANGGLNIIDFKGTIIVRGTDNSYSPLDRYRGMYTVLNKSQSRIIIATLDNMNDRSRIELRDFRTGQTATQFRLPNATEINCFSPDDEMIAIATISEKRQKKITTLK
jgi:WD40 repeat protein